jgi:protein-disulfide isomerase
MTKRFVRLLTAIFLALQLPIACAQQQTTSSAQPAVPSNEISSYIRKAFNVPENVKINVSETPSEIPGLRAVKIEFVSDRGSQTQEAWVTDQNRLIVGRSFDLTADPYQKNWEKIDLANVPTTGGADAKVTIVEYSDFQCPFCSRAHETMKSVVQVYNGQVKLMYKHLPLEMHNWAEDAAIASACVYQQDQEAFWKLSDYLFANQKAVTKETLTDKVIEATNGTKVNADKLKQCIAARQTNSVVQANMAEAKKLGFNSTPSFVINGRTVVGALNADQFKQIIDEMMKTAK